MRARIKKALHTSLHRLSSVIGRAAAYFAPILTEPEKFKNRLTHLQQLWFVADVPLFIDSLAVSQLYDALSRPEYESISRQASTSTTKGKEIQDGLNLGGKFGVPPFLEISGSLKGGNKRMKSNTTSDSVMQEANRSAEMRLEQIIRQYVANYPTRLLWTSVNSSELRDIEGNPTKWGDLDAMIGEPAPRPLIVLDLLPFSKLLPMAAETEDGKMHLLYNEFRYETGKHDSLPKYPKDRDPKKFDSRQEYWMAFDAAFDSHAAMRVVEGCTDEASRIEWIDYRLIGKAKDGTIVPFHLHFAPRGKHSTGTFAYQTVRRGYTHGLRLVGTLKSGLDMNVLAMYET
jgi:hypothetical protein